jgi:hypothetical protein
VEGSNQLGLGEAFNIPWSNYIRALKTTHICILDIEDEIVWKHAPHGSYIPKLGYIQLNIEKHFREPSWWWKGLWKV